MCSLLIGCSVPQTPVVPDQLPDQYSVADSEYLDLLRESKSVTAGNGDLSPTEVIRNVVEFVHDNSLHLLDEEYIAYAFKTPYVLKRIMEKHRDDSRRAPHLSCGSRSLVAKEILGNMGIRARLVQVYSDYYPNVEGHRMLEIFNPETKSWEVWDPDYRVTYIDSVTSLRVDIMQLIRDRSMRVIPQSETGRGWALASPSTDLEPKGLHYFKAVMFEGSGSPTSVIVVNQLKFDMKKKFSDGLTFSEWAFKAYGTPRIILIP